MNTLKEIFSVIFAIAAWIVGLVFIAFLFLTPIAIVYKILDAILKF